MEIDCPPALFLTTPVMVKFHFWAPLDLIAGRDLRPIIAKYSFAG
jgi:hypothetical protein